MTPGPVAPGQPTAGGHHPGRHLPYPHRGGGTLRRAGRPRSRARPHDPPGHQLVWVPDQPKLKLCPIEEQLTAPRPPPEHVAPA